MGEKMKKRKLEKGILKSGFTIHNTVYSVSIPKGANVSFYYDRQSKTQEIYFKGISVYLFRNAYQGKFDRWLASVFGRVMSVHYEEPAPYPISYFK